MIISRSENQELRTTKASQIGTYDAIFVLTRLQQRPATNGLHLLLTHSRQATTVLGKMKVEVCPSPTPFLPHLAKKRKEKKRRKLNTWVKKCLEW